jgi:DHA1 family tetracycline resistance protein-like MFS transporter
MNKQIIVLLFVVLFGFIGVAMPYPIFSPLFLHPGQHGIISAQWSVTARGIFLGLTLAAYPLGQFVGAPVLGSLSDQYGRKLLLAVSMVGTGICYAISGIAIQHGLVWLLIISRLVTGCLEGNLSIAQASIIDLGVDKHKGFGAVSAMAGLGYVFGPLFGGLLSDGHLVSWFNYALPFYFAAIIALFTAVVIRLWIKESLTPRQVNKKTLAAQFNMIGRFRRLAKIENLKYLLVVSFFLSMSIDAYYEFFPALLTSRWHMTAANIAGYTVVLSISLIIGSYGLALFLRQKFTTSTAFLTTAIIFPLGFLLMLITTRSVFLYLQFILIGLSYGAASTFNTVLVSDTAANNQQGEVLGVRWSLRMLGDALICVFGGLLISVSINLPIILAIIFAGLCVIFFLRKP